MAIPRKKITRRAALAGLGGLAAATRGGPPGEGEVGAAQPQPPPRLPGEVVPVRGKAGPGLESSAAPRRKTTARPGARGPPPATPKTARPAPARGSGGATPPPGGRGEPQPLFGIASLSKPLTAA